MDEEHMMIKRAKEVVDYPDTVIPNYTAVNFAKYILQLYRENAELKKELNAIKRSNPTVRFQNQEIK